MLTAFDANFPGVTFLGEFMTWNQIKWIAIITMTIDHAALALPLPSITILGFPLYHVMRILGRAAFPIFAYGICQGCLYTHNYKKYLLRLLIFAFISEVPFQLALRQGTLRFHITNVFFTLFAGAVCCVIIKISRIKRLCWVSIFPILAIVLFCEMNHTDYGGIGVLFILVPYIFNKNKKTQIISLSIIVAFFYIFVSMFSGFTYPQFAWMTSGSNLKLVVQDLIGASLGVFLLLLYNGQKGTCKSKWFFYIYYPLHLIVIYFLNLFFAINSKIIFPIK